MAAPEPSAIVGPSQIKPELRPFPIQRTDGNSFQDKHIIFGFHPVYGRTMGLTKGDEIRSGVFISLKNGSNFTLNAIPGRYYILVLKGSLAIQLAVPTSETYTSGQCVEIEDSPTKAHCKATVTSNEGLMALLLIKDVIPEHEFETIVDDKAKVAFSFDRLRVTKGGGSTIDSIGQELNKVWKRNGILSSGVVKLQAISFSDVAPECVAPLHPAYSKYLNWTTFLGSGRAEFGTSDGMTREVGAGHIVYFDDAEGEGHAYRVANYKPVKQIFITLEREVTRWGEGKTGFESGLAGLSWEQAEELKKKGGKL
ncbi:hypothetical protein SmJEL517_g05694 [Synchytrium microbalum]|uniref:Uncharacterized protein n=1 Tax=Synchytrium microbalum TaxID=1806994 RepID=A0A507BJU7_9FUNG|nr:uncharacterized protein SmJEL517_g05694 [Synchytrium microbalum]TPX30830.1 hypothetical protein SmJEL517_g05694 [Synchytrium microbalum]